MTIFLGGGGQGTNSQDKAARDGPRPLQRKKPPLPEPNPQGWATQNCRKPAVTVAADYGFAEDSVDGDIRQNYLALCIL